jgi:nucleoside-diphosphate-sugar epimerase
VNVSRGSARPYRTHHAWDVIENVAIDRAEEEKAGTFGARIAELNGDIVVDMIAFDLASTKQVVEAIREKVEHYIFCSTIWVYGGLTIVPHPKPIPSA